MNTSLLSTVLDPKQLSVHFQPIFRIHSRLRQVHALEALVRGPGGTNFERADLLFDYIRRKKAENAMDRTCFLAICEAAAVLPAQLRLNINVHAATLAQTPEFPEFVRAVMAQYSLSLDRLTIEIVEHTPPCNVSQLINGIDSLRDAGVRIALDDVGLGQSNYRMMLDCDPEYFKLDGYFVRGLHLDKKRQAVVHSITALATALDSAVVAEGAETQEELAALSGDGVEFVQSNILCPAMAPENLARTGLLGHFATRGEQSCKSEPGDKPQAIVLGVPATS